MQVLLEALATSQQAQASRQTLIVYSPRRRGLGIAGGVHEVE
jgi:hypothetical protein